MRRTDADRLAAFQVARWMDVFGGFVCDRPAMMRATARWESRFLEDRLATVPIETPTWVTGLARSGSTILLELLAMHPDVATHRYQDFPLILSPVLWNRLLDFMPLRPEEPAERAHMDGIFVTSQSPEAFEEPIWMAFFDRLHDPHDPRRQAVLDGTVENPAFEAFFRDHIRKIMLVRGRGRYLSKANYNVTRLDYLLKLFPDARFVVPVRDPLWHVASLVKQHRLFCAGESRYPAARRHLARVGHFEFGLDRRPIHCGNQAAVDDILGLWAAGREAEGWALQWAEVYGLLAGYLDSSPALRRATLIVRYEDLCMVPRKTLATVLDHARLKPSDDLLRLAEERLHFPGYYHPAFSEPEREAIHTHTAAVARYFGYEE